MSSFHHLGFGVPSGSRRRGGMRCGRGAVSGRGVSVMEDFEEDL